MTFQCIRVKSHRDNSASLFLCTAPGQGRWGFQELNCVGVSCIRYLQKYFFETSSLQDRNS
jgi:hypothetical protein